MNTGFFVADNPDFIDPGMLCCCALKWILCFNLTGYNLLQTDSFLHIV